MKISEHALLKFAESPFLVTTEGAIEWCSRFSLEEVPAARADGKNFFGDDLPKMSVRDGVAIVPVNGILIHGAGYLEKQFGAQSHSDIGDMLTEAEADPNVRAILLDINSPGGSVVGTPELAGQIARLTKPTSAYSDRLCASAAYWLASQCQAIYTASCSMMGSIGAVLQFVNVTEALAAAGVKVEMFTSGKLKAAGSPYKVMTDGERDHFQNLVNSIGAKFKSGVKAKRRTIGDDSMEGQAFLGSEAVSRGLADKVVSGLSEVLAIMPGNRKDEEMVGFRPPKGASADTYDAEWRASAALQRSFPSAANYAAFKRAELRGLTGNGRGRRSRSAAHAPTVTASTVPAQSDLAAQWRNSPELQKQFTSPEAFGAFERAKAKGLVGRVSGPGRR